VIYPRNLTGPQFATSDLIEFVFEGSAITLPVPQIPNYSQRLDKVSPIKNFENRDTSTWELIDADEMGNQWLELIHQQWRFEDSKTLDDIAICHFKVMLIAVNEQNKMEHTLLNLPAFKKLMIEAIIAELDEEDIAAHADDPDWPNEINEFKIQYIPQPHLDWFQVQLSFIEGNQPFPFAFIPLNSQFAMNISFDMKTLHDDVRVNPYSDELIRKVEFDLFDEYMQSINLHYTDEVLKAIKASA